MEQRPLGGSGLSVSALGFGCGAVGGLMVRGTAAEQARAVARAIERGVTYFDTAASYGDGASEAALGRALAGRRDVTIGTKVRIAPADRAAIASAITFSIEASLARLGRETVDLVQLHNPITLDGAGQALTPREVIGQALPAMAKARAAGKLRAFGITGLGDAAAIADVLADPTLASAQMPFNLLNPSGIDRYPCQPGMPALGGTISMAAGRGVGVMAIRVLAGGALSGSEARGPLGSPHVTPIGSGASYAADAAAARARALLAAACGAADLISLGIRFAAMQKEIATVLIGIGSITELDHALDAIAAGPLPIEPPLSLGAR